MRLGGAQSPSGCSGEEKISCPAGIQTADALKWSLTDYTIPAQPTNIIVLL